MKNTKLHKIAADLHALADNLLSIAETPPEPEQKHEAEKKALSLEEVRAVLAEKSRTGHTAEIRALLLKHGADRLSAIDPGEYAVLLAEAEGLKDAS